MTTPTAVAKTRTPTRRLGRHRCETVSRADVVDAEPVPVSTTSRTPAGNKVRPGETTEYDVYVISDQQLESGTHRRRWRTGSSASWPGTEWRREPQSPEILSGGPSPAMSRWDRSRGPAGESAETIQSDDLDAIVDGLGELWCRKSAGP